MQIINPLDPEVRSWMGKGDTAISEAAKIGMFPEEFSNGTNVSDEAINNFIVSLRVSGREAREKRFYLLWKMVQFLADAPNVHLAVTPALSNSGHDIELAFTTITTNVPLDQQPLYIKFDQTNNFMLYYSMLFSGSIAPQNASIHLAYNGIHSFKTFVAILWNFCKQKALWSTRENTQTQTAGPAFVALTRRTISPWLANLQMTLNTQNRIVH